MKDMQSTLHALKFFRLPLFILFAGIFAGFYIGGWEQGIVVAILAILEISLSFDNAVLNAGVLQRLGHFWRTMFLTVGILVAVIGMRLIFPIVIVMVTAGLSFQKVIDLALNHPEIYAKELTSAHPSIAAFGGMFLLMIFLDFLLNEAKRVHWVNLIEAPLAKAGQLKTLSSLIALVLLLIAAKSSGHMEEVLVAGVLGQVTYLLVTGLTRLFEHVGGLTDESKHGTGKVVMATGKAAFMLFVYLNVLDASFSFDGVIAAFAVSTNVITIALGLGIGAFFIRELTIWLVEHDTLKEFKYLEHGAHYAVGALAVLMGVSLVYHVPEAVTGLIGAGLIALSLMSSVAARPKTTEP
ncbi:MAG: hypothetical protein K0S68_213 [Candidatus Saccharibacteria bacterium]|nr:hypothetical protein [Candidatus Saccharibacteria bacterium]